MSKQTKRKHSTGQLCPNCNNYMTRGNLVDLKYTNNVAVIECMACGVAVTVTRHVTTHFSTFCDAQS